jgi:hypothetical protein
VIVTFIWQGMGAPAVVQLESAWMVSGDADPTM